MLTIVRNKLKTNDKTLTLNSIILNNNIDNIQTKSETDEYNKMIFYPFSTKEWCSSIYSYNKSYTKILISHGTRLNKTFKSYFNMLIENKVSLFRHRRHNRTRYSANKIYLSNAELEHINTDLFITLYSYNKQKLSIMRRIRKLITLKKFRKIIDFEETIFIPYLRNRIFHILKKTFILVKNWNISLLLSKYNIVEPYLPKLSLRSIKHTKPYRISLFKRWFLKRSFKYKDLLAKTTKWIHFNTYKSTSISLKYLDLGILSLIEKIYEKNVNICVVLQKAIFLNSNLFSSAVALKLRDRLNKPIRVLRKAIIKMVRIPDLHTLITFDSFIELMNKYNIINTIKQQIVSGVRFVASGRLTKRLIAMRAVVKVRYAGSLKNIRASFNNLASTMLRGFVKSNLEYSRIDSKTKNGTFGLKTWISSHHLIFYSDNVFLCNKGNILTNIKYTLFSIFFIDLPDTLLWLYHSHMDILVLIILFILPFLDSIIAAFIRNLEENFYSSKSPVSNKYGPKNPFEWIYKIIPTFFLILIALPSFNSLGSMNEITNPLNIIECSSPSAANEAFSRIDAVILPRLTNLAQVENNPIPQFDFSKLDKMMTELKTNMHSMSEDRIITLEKKIQDNLDQLKVKGIEVQKTFFPKYIQLHTTFNQLSNFIEFKDLSAVLNKITKISLEDAPKPLKELLESDPDRFWKEQIKYANKVHEKNITILNLFKKYVISKDLLSMQHKTELFTSIKALKKISEEIATTDKMYFKENLENSKILAEIRMIKGL